MTVSVTTIELSCLSCGGRWTQRRRRGQYPLRCTRCRNARRRSPRELARRLEAHAHRKGIDATARGHGRHGWTVWVRTPWHDRPVILRDVVDIDYLAAELANATT